MERLDLKSENKLVLKIQVLRDVINVPRIIAPEIYKSHSVFICEKCIVLNLLMSLCVTKEERFDQTSTLYSVYQLASNKLAQKFLFHYDCKALQIQN